MVVVVLVLIPTAAFKEEQARARAEATVRSTTGGVDAERLERAGFVRLAESRPAGIVFVVLAVVMSVLATYWIIQTGHSGAESVWHDVRIVRSGEG